MSYAEYAEKMKQDNNNKWQENKNENNKKENWSSSRYPSISDIINKEGNENDEYDEEIEEMARREEMRAFYDAYGNGGHFADGSDNNPFR